MAIDSKEQFITIVYEYLYNHGNRLELKYKNLLDDHYRALFSRLPEKYIYSDELLKIIEMKSRVEEYRTIEKELCQLIQFYRDH